MSSADMSRLEFLKGAVAALGLGALGGRRVFAVPPGWTPSGSLILTFGVVSDTHMRVANNGTGFMYDGTRGYDDASDTRFKIALNYFKSNSVDAVVHCGDMAHNGIKKEVEFHKAALDAVFAGYGKSLVNMFVPGNHDMEGWCYDGHAKDVYGNNYLRGLLVNNFTDLDISESWREIWGEDYSEAWHKVVNGVHFFGYAWREDSINEHSAFQYQGESYSLYHEEVYQPRTDSHGNIVTDNQVLRENAGMTLSSAVVNGFKMIELIEQAREADANFDKKPFFIITHQRPLSILNKAMSQYRNGLCLFGHWHGSAALCDSDNELTWPRYAPFPEIQCPSLAFQGGGNMPTELPFALATKKSGKSGRQTWGLVDGYKLEYDSVKKTKPNDYFQGFLVKVYSTAIMISRLDFDKGHNCAKLGADWVVEALPSSSSRPWWFAEGEHPLSPAKMKTVDEHDLGAPRFRTGAALQTQANDGKVILTIPKADGNSNNRALIYNVEIVGKAGRPSYWKSVYAAGCNDGIGQEWNGGVTKYTINASELPVGDTLLFKVYPVSACGTSGSPISARLKIKQKAVKVRVKKGSAFVRGGAKIALTDGAGLPDDAKMDIECPEWAQRADVEDGELFLDTKPGFSIRVR